jgi:hypothetical protein
MMHIILNSVHETETKAVNLLNHLNAEIIYEKCDVISNKNPELFCKCSLEEKAISLYEAVKVETVTKEGGFQALSDDDRRIVGILFCAVNDSGTVRVGQLDD